MTQLPSWIEPAAGEWLLAMMWHEDAELQPARGAHVRFAPTMTTHQLYYDGGPLHSAPGEPRRHVSGVVMSEGPWLLAADVPIVLNDPHPFGVGSQVDVDGVVELDGDDSHVREPFASDWEIVELGAWRSTVANRYSERNDASSRRLERIAGVGEDLEHLLVRCRLVRAGHFR